ncbi:MAG: superoxide dismutase [Alphaproteobacteria bacterium]|nr:superoxide dismutase [Alphaproteobacteria bacterium]NCQ88249.1 superoxide dismutase [Alphaproteobacteria bacterium]NCT05244.1 superoxide dismutase [Alphaproteobacteria bacterium]
MTFTLPELPYGYDALGPYMSAETLEFHHDKHHMAYITKGNELIAGTALEKLSLEEAMVAAHKDPAKAGLFNQLGQHFNHIHFWHWMKPNGGGTSMDGKLEAKIAADLGGYDGFKKGFIDAGITQFGSGWCWLAMDNATGKLEIIKTPNGENPVVFGKTALLGCDVWEHSYYIDYRNARPKYLEAFVDNLINWDYVAELFEKGPMEIKAAA